MEKRIKGKSIAIIISGDYGMGWYTQHKKKVLLYDPLLVDAIACEDIEAAKQRIKEIDPDFFTLVMPYCENVLENLEIFFVPIGCLFKITCYDGKESVEVRYSDGWLMADVDPSNKPICDKPYEGQREESSH